MMLIKPLISMVILLFAPVVMASNFYANKPRGFMWYLEDRRTNDSTSLEKVTPEVARTKNQALAARLDDAIQVLLDRPTLQNAIYAQRLQNIVMARSEKVSKAWVLAALLDSGLLKKADNQNVLHRELAKTENQGIRKARLQNIAQEWGILFYWNKECVYCQRFMPILEEIEHEYKFKILAVSRQGGDYGKFKGVVDTGVISQFNPRKLAPLLFLVHKSGKKIYPIARGITDADKIAENILAVTEFSRSSK